MEDYLAPLAQSGKLTEPGTVSSYNNTAWIIAEIVLRKVTGKNFHELLEERVIAPLGLRRTVLSAREALLHRTAIGSFQTETAENRSTPKFMFPDAWAAPGATLITTVNDTMSFLRMHLAVGELMNGTRLLSTDSVLAMQTPTSPDPTGWETGFCLGWRYLERDGAGGSLPNIAC